MQSRSVFFWDHILVIVAGLIYPLLIIAFYLNAGFHGMPWGTDFHVFYDTARRLAAGDTHIYNRAMLESYLSLTNGLPAQANEGWPFPYPPSMGLLLWPLAALPYTPAFWLWITVGIGFFSWAQGLALKPYLPGWTTLRLYGLSLFLSIFSPFALADIITGQSGHIFAALLVLAVFQAPGRPWLAALALGFLSLKPQLAVLAAIILLLGGYYRVLFFALPVALAIADVSAGVWGMAIWVDYTSYIQQFSHSLSVKPDALQVLTLSMYSTLRLLGAPVALAVTAYGMVALSAGVSLLRMALKPQPQAPVLLAGSVLLLPYVMWHDVVFLNIPILWLMSRSWRTGFLPAEFIGLSLILFGVPLCVLYLNVHVNLSVLLAIALFGLLVRRERSEGE